MSKIFKKITRSYSAGTVIFKEGQACDGIYYLTSGRVSIYKTKPTPTGPMEYELISLGAGSMFGEMGMLGHAKREASVKALEYCEVLIITPNMFEAQMAALPAWVHNFIKILISRLRATNDKLLTATQEKEASEQGLVEEEDSSAPPVI